MHNILLTGIGGQGTVLAAKLLAQAASNRGWQVRTAETIGMAQRGGNVVSHVRIGEEGEEVVAPLLAKGTADCIVAFEPGEAARVLPYLTPQGVLVTASTAVQPITSALASQPYSSEGVIDALRSTLENTPATLVVVDDAAALEAAGSRKVLNVVLLACAVKTGLLPFTMDELRDAVRACVKPRFVDMNLNAIESIL